MFAFAVMTMFTTVNAQTLVVDTDLSTIEEPVTVDTVIADLDVLQQDLQLFFNNGIRSSIDQLVNDVGKQLEPSILYLNNTITENTVNVVNNTAQNNYYSSSGNNLLNTIINQSKQQYSSIMSRQGID